MLKRSQNKSVLRRQFVIKNYKVDEGNKVNMTLKNYSLNYILFY